MLLLPPSPANPTNICAAPRELASISQILLPSHIFDLCSPMLRIRQHLTPPTRALARSRILPVTTYWPANSLH
jgi:hypothetical protein